MTSKRFRIYYNGTPATQDQLDRVEEISIEQEVDAAWEARLQLSICLDDSGNWQHLEESFMAEFSRVRIEIQIDTDPWVALIDGPVVNVHSELHSEPGRSVVTVIVQDDSVLLNRTASVEVHEGEPDSDIATAVFSSVPQITADDIETATPSSDPLGGATVQRETGMQFLRRLARRNGFHAYVLPADEVGQPSRGCFKRFATDATSGLPDLVLLGDDRNIENFSANNDAQSASRYTARTVTISDRGTVDQTSDFTNVALLGDQPAYDSEADTGQDFLGPHQLDEDPNRSTGAATELSSYSVHATGRALPDCYDGILRAYDVVTMRAGPTSRSGKFVVSRVRHVINRSLHTQEFSLLGNSSSTVDSAGGNPLSGVF